MSKYTQRKTKLIIKYMQQTNHKHKTTEKYLKFTQIKQKEYNKKEQIQI